MDNNNDKSSNIKKGIGLGFGNCLGIIMFIVVLIIIVDVISGNKSGNKSSTTSSDSTANINQNKEIEKPQGKVEVKSDRVNPSGYGTQYIVGEVENKTTGDVTFVKVTATCYDKDGKVTGTNFTWAGDTPNVPLGVTLTAPFEVIIDKGIVLDHYKLDITWR